jgi:CRP/FNR family transcriptional regulator, cyclic AMP receptor protein
VDRIGIGTLVSGRPPKRGPGDPLGPGWVEVLREIPLFAGLSKRQVRRIANAARAQRFAPGAPIVRKGQRGETFFVILDGDATVQLSRGRSRRVGAGDYFGELALLDGEPRSATIVAKTPVLAMRLSRRRFHALLASDAQLAIELLKGITARLRTAERAVNEASL